MKLSIIVPVLNESTALPVLLAQLLPLRRGGVDVLVVDGDSEDGSATIAECAGFRVVRSQRGRARQMNAGARAARGDVLLFLHADTRLPDGAERLIHAALADGRHVWGRFDVEFDVRTWTMDATAFGMNLRSRLTGIATGDQGIFVTRAAFDAVGGFPDQPLMEDVEITSRLRARSRPACIGRPVVTSARRWQARGAWRTIFLMWRLRLAYWRGASPADLARQYQ
ncbi:MAG TPA: TIGR04283 family arsenosugar biosynthesis glycosyltransferase [Burkholderiaceae bacterium]|nr:TIGR04283 family arsenosugar biosynthesis glycosyltransferase [Burkholderiaceae bacterium]